MQSYNLIRDNLNNSFWVSNADYSKNQLIQLYFPSQMVMNNKFAYMGYALILNPTPYYYYPTTSFFDIQIGVDGKLHVPFTHSTSITDKEIRLANGDIWNRVTNIPKNTSVNYIDLNEIRKSDIQNTEYLFNKMYPIYGSHPVVKGQKIPQ